MTTTIATRPATSTPAPASGPARYLAPSRGEIALGRLAVRLTRWGLSFRGSRELVVRGRRSGLDRSTVVNVLELHGTRYLVSPRGTTDWVRNLRAAGTATLRLGRRTEAVEAVELPDQDKPAVLRAYLERWAFEVGRFFEGTGADADDDALAAIADRHPVFELR